MLPSLLAACSILGALVVHVLAGWRQDRRTLWALAALDFVLVGLFAAAFHDDVWNGWLREDAWLEWATFFAFAAAGAVFLRHARATGGLARLAGVGLGLFCLFVAGEEVSWGQRLFAFEPPELFLAENYQQELNLHNLLKDKSLGVLALDSRVLVALVALLYGVLGAALPWLPRVGERLRPLCPTPALSPFFAGVAWLEWAYPMHLSGEAAECVLGLVFVADASLRQGGLQLSARLTAGILALGAVTSPLLALAWYGTDQARSDQAHAELQALAQDVDEGVTRRLEKKGRVHKRVFTAVRDGYLDLSVGSAFLEGQDTPANDHAAAPRRDRRGYFLDPWNNPYWILSQDGGDALSLYSFGPNRRRDTETKPLGEFEGDDIGVRIR